MSFPTSFLQNVFPDLYGLKSQVYWYSMNALFPKGKTELKKKGAICFELQSSCSLIVNCFTDTRLIKFIIPDIFSLN